MLETDLERRLQAAGRFDEAAGIRVAAVQVNDFGEGEYEARFRYDGGAPGEEDEGYLAGLKRRIEDVLPRAWVAAFGLSSRTSDVHEVTVTFDYLPEGSLTRS